MHPHCDADTALDALVRGQDPGDDFWPLKALAADVAVVTSGPAPEPSPALATMLRGAPPVVPAHMRPRSRPARVVASVAHLGTAARVALGAAVAVGGIATAGATGHLPEPVAKAVQPLVDLFTPFGLPADPSPSGAIGLRHGATGDAPAPPPVTEVPVPGAATPAPATEAPPDVPVAGVAREGGGAPAPQPDGGAEQPVTAPAETPADPLVSPPQAPPSPPDAPGPGSQGSGGHPSPTPPTPAPPIPPTPTALGIAPGGPPLTAGGSGGPGLLDQATGPQPADGPLAGPPAGSTGGGPAGRGDTMVP